MEITVILVARVQCRAARRMILSDLGLKFIRRVADFLTAFEYQVLD